MYKDISTRTSHYKYVKINYSEIYNNCVCCDLFEIDHILIDKLITNLI